MIDEAFTSVLPRRLNGLYVGIIDFFLFHFFPLSSPTTTASRFRDWDEDKEDEDQDEHVEELRRIMTVRWPV